MRPVNVVAAALVVGDRVLAAQRAAPKSDAGRWELPGGKTEPGEHEAEALVRELDEELGIDVEALWPLTSTLHHTPARTLRLAVWIARLRPGGRSAPELREHAAVRWLRAGELAEVAWTAADAGLVHLVGEWLEAGAVIGPGASPVAALGEGAAVGVAPAVSPVRGPIACRRTLAEALAAGRPAEVEGLGLSAEERAWVARRRLG